VKNFIHKKMLWQKLLLACHLEEAIANSASETKLIIYINFRIAFHKVHPSLTITCNAITSCNKNMFTTQLFMAKQYAQHHAKSKRNTCDFASS